MGAGFPQAHFLIPCVWGQQGRKATLGDANEGGIRWKTRRRAAPSRRPRSREAAPRTRRNRRKAPNRTQKGRSRSRLRAAPRRAPQREPCSALLQVWRRSTCARAATARTTRNRVRNRTTTIRSETPDPFSIGNNGHKESVCFSETMEANVADDENMIDDEEGMSTPKKVVAGAALGVAIPAAVGVAKKLIGNGDENGDDSQDDAAAKPRRSSSRTGSSRGRSSAGRSTSRARSARGGSARRGSTSRK